jgi:hypothetical protein
MWLEQICPDIPMSSSVYTSLVLPSHQHVPITNGRYKLQTLEGFSLKSCEINDFAPLRVTLKHRAVIFGPTSWRCEPVCTWCAYVNHFWPSEVVSGWNLEPVKGENWADLVAPLQRFQWPCDLLYTCVRWHVEKRGAHCSTSLIWCIVHSWVSAAGSTNLRTKSCTYLIKTWPKCTCQDHLKVLR